MTEITPEDLLGTSQNPAGYDILRAWARKARAYHELAPYPNFGFQEWKDEERGPLPRCLPFVRGVVTKGARWLFGRPVQWTVPGNDEIAKRINNIWSLSGMGSKAVQMAETAAISGNVALKWSYDEDRGEEPVRLHVLDGIEHCRFYFDPHDISKLLMCRVTYPFFNPKDGNWYWYREDWTDKKHVIYVPQPVKTFFQNNFTDPYATAPKADAYEHWVQESEDENPFGIIPIWLVKNTDTGKWFGEGDLWRMFPTVDQINFTFDLSHKNNQKAIDPTKAFIDLEAPDEDPVQAEAAGSEIVMNSVSDKDGRVELLEPKNTIREHVRQFGEDLQMMLYEVIGSVRIRPEDITNKGNLTQAVMTQLYAPLIEVTSEKRKLYGEDGICIFFEKMSEGLKDKGFPGTIDVQAAWPEMVPPTEVDLAQAVSRQAQMVEKGFTTQDRAVRALAAMEDANDVDLLVKEAQEEYESRKQEELRDMAGSTGGGVRPAPKRKG